MPKGERNQMTWLRFFRKSTAIFGSRMCEGIQILHILPVVVCMNGKWKSFWTKKQLNPVIIATGYYCGKKANHDEIHISGIISTLENERK